MVKVLSCGKLERRLSHKNIALPLSGTCGVLPMMSSDKCRRRAKACTASAYGHDDDNARRALHQLSELWLKWSDVVGPLTDPKRIAVCFPPNWRRPADTRNSVANLPGALPTKTRDVLSSDFPPISDMDSRLRPDA